MAFLKTPIGDGRTIVDLYREKQKAWGQAKSDWDKAKIEAQRELALTVQPFLLRDRS